jgi:hypothetical protein
MSKHARKRNLDRIVLFEPKTDIKGERYLPFCDYGLHRGFVNYPTKCEKKKPKPCRHYVKLYLNGKCYQ